MEAGTLVRLMTAAEARRCAEQIRRGMADVRYLLLDFHEREGWRALGYQNWRECAMTEFGYGQSHVYELLEAARTERAIADVSDTSEKTIPVRQLRPLAGLQPEAKREVWTKAVETAPEGKITAKHVERTVVEWKSGNRTERDDSAYKPNKLPPKPVPTDDDTPKTVTLRVARVVYLMTLGRWMTLEEIAGITGLSVNGAWRLMDRLAGGHHVPVTDDENGRWGILGVDSDDMPY